MIFSKSVVHDSTPAFEYRIVQEPRAIYIARWEIIAREFLTVAYISMNTSYTLRYPTQIN